MPYQELYRAAALEGALFYTVCIRKAALLIALDNDIRDQSEVDAELPNGGDYAAWMSPELEPIGKLKAARDMYERALVKSHDAGRLKASVTARNVNDAVDPLYTLVPLAEIREWCLHRDVDTGDWLSQYEESEFEFASEMLDDIARHYELDPVEPDPYDAAALEMYRSSEASGQVAQYQRLLQEVQKLRADSAPSHKIEPETPINTKEKNSLLTVIAALVTAMGDRLPDGYKRAEAVARLTDQIGASVSVNTVDKILKQTDNAVDRRREAYK